ncbi:hypothetical protein QBC47DRAFT_231 [Echria macrotheca]|uniref:Uncharacterized protein n=1 Tax=Echria macrotheca TaxID=438768 RepID=A0AAJ0BLC0_9PEZI|nr:hypothetical protein QBC47DRAFT_231 [Echria macrotheca]
MFTPFGTELNSTAQWHPEPETRGTYSLLSSCLLTMLVCVWSSVHLNIPQSGCDNHLLKRLGWLIIATVTPESVVFVSWSQWKQARKISGLIFEKFNYPKERKLWQKNRPSDVENNDTKSRPRLPFEWTMKQSFYVVMGGLSIRDRPDVLECFDSSPGLYPDRHKSNNRHQDIRLTPRGFLALVDLTPELIPEILPDISNRYIDDKSKADSFIKAGLIVQASWFCIQCLFRLITGLSISLLELNALAHCFCSVPIYLCWTHKPFGILEPSYITIGDHSDLFALMGMCSKYDFDIPEINYLRYRELDPSHEVQIQPDAKEWEVTFGKSLFGLSMPRFGYDTLPCGLRVPHYLRVPRARDIYLKENGMKRWKFASDAIQRYGFWEQRSRGWKPPTTPAEKTDFMLSRRNLRRRLMSFENCFAFTVPNYVNPFGDTADPNIGTRNEKEVFQGSESLAGIVYGGLHMTAWNAPFPTDAQSLLWKVSSITLMAVGAAGTVLLTLIWLQQRQRQDRDAREAYQAAGSEVEYFDDYVVPEQQVQQPRSKSLYERDEKQKDERGVLMTLRPTALFLALIMLGVTYVCYVLLFFMARVFILVESFLVIPWLPDSVFLSPRWSKYFPHLS